MRKHAGTRQAVYASAVRFVLEEAAKKGMHSVAMPLLGCGNAHRGLHIRGWPIKLAATISIERTLDFFYGTGGGMSTSLKVMCCMTKGHRLQIVHLRLQMMRERRCWAG